MAYQKLITFTDGGARGNPGPAGIGGVIWDAPKTKITATISKYIGVATNNQAEYRALIATLEKARDLGAQEVACYLDSELLVKQLKQEYRVRDKDLAALFVQVWNLILGFKKISFHHVPRERNKDADKLVNQAIDREMKLVRKENLLDVGMSE